MTLHVRTSGDPAAGPDLIREVIGAMDPDLGLRQPGSFARRLELLLLPQRVASALIGLFGMTGLILAATGLFGLLAFHVEQQRREIAVRIALGGKADDVMKMILRRVGILVGLGVGVGLGGTLLLTPLAESFLYGVSALDPLTLALGPLLLVIVALAASWVPARRALGVDPMTLLRTE